MKRCPRCKLRKPDSLFVSTLGGRGRCYNCRTIKSRIKPHGGPMIRTIQAEPIEISKLDRALSRIAWKEKKAFKKRGSPEVERPYSYIGGKPEAGMVSRGVFKREGG